MTEWNERRRERRKVYENVEKRNERKTSLRIRRRTCKHCTHLWSTIVIFWFTKITWKTREADTLNTVLSFMAKHFSSSLVLRLQRLASNNAPPRRAIKARMIYLFIFKVTSWVIFRVLYGIFTCVLFASGGNWRAFLFAERAKRQ